MLKRYIPIFGLNPNAIAGLHIHGLNIRDEESEITHRDDHYLIFILLGGKCNVEIDMRIASIVSPAVVVLTPGQIHKLIDSKEMKGFLISVEAFLIPENCISLFEKIEIQKQLEADFSKFMETIESLAQLLIEEFNADNYLSSNINRALFEALIYKIASILKVAYPETRSVFYKNQPERITSDFKELLQNTGSKKATPSFFAEKLNITSAHLNDCVKNTTGWNVTHWIQKAMIKEAQKLLFYTDQTVKEIAFELGFADHTYFSRLFKKAYGLSPGAFRLKFRR